MSAISELKRPALRGLVACSIAVCSALTDSALAPGAAPALSAPALSAPALSAPGDAGADLDLRVVSVPTLGAEDSGVVELSLTNLGPAPAGTTRLNYVLRRGVSHDETAVPSSCALIDETLTCTISGPIPVSSTITVALPVRTGTWLPMGDGFATSTASLSDQSVLDPDRANDSVAIDIALLRPSEPTKAASDGAHTQANPTPATSVLDRSKLDPSATDTPPTAASSDPADNPLSADGAPESLAFDTVSSTWLTMFGLALFVAALWLIGSTYRSSDGTGA